MPRNQPLSEEEKAHLRALALERSKGGTQKKGQVPAASGGDPPSGAGSGSGSGAAGHGAGDDPAHGGGGAAGGGAGGGAGAGRAASRVGRKIPRTEKALEIVVDSGKFFKGLPAFSRLLFRAANNVLKIFNLLPLPFTFEVEDMTPEESELFAEAVRPGLEQSLPSAGRKHPFIMMGAAFVVAVVGKLKAKLKTRPAKKPESEISEAEVVQ